MATRGTAWLVLTLGTACALGQAPSGLPASSPTAGALPKAVTPDRIPAHRAVVQYQNGRLWVEANDSSLNQILWAIGQRMGLKITGGVVEERVYGSYGPDDPAKILSALLDGTGSNMLLKQGAKPGTSALVLTPRGGGVTPPSPAPGPDVADAPSEDRPPTPTRTREAFLADPASSAPAPVAVPGGAAPVNAPAGMNTALPQSPNGVKTPQQIYEQLLKLQQQTPKTNPQ